MANPAAAAAAARTLWAPPMHAKSHSCFGGIFNAIGPLGGWYEYFKVSCFWQVSMVIRAPSTVWLAAPQHSPSSELHGTLFLRSPLLRGLSHRAPNFPEPGALRAAALSFINFSMVFMLSFLVAWAASQVTRNALYWATSHAATAC